MDNLLKLFAVITAMGGAGVLMYGAVAFIGVAVKRMERGTGVPAALEGEVAELRTRVEENEGLRDRVLELEERLDFTERLLTQQREPGALPARENR